MQAKSKKYGKDSTAWAEGNGTSEHEPWAKSLRRGPRFVASTKGIRLRPEQIVWINEQIAADPEETWSRIARRGVDLVKAEREGRLQVLVPAQ